MPIIYEPWRPPYRTFYQCPLCDEWEFEEPAPRFDSTLVYAGVHTDDLVFDALRRQAAEVEAAMREHLTEHTARVMLSGQTST